jgi:hypothetical protein
VLAPSRATVWNVYAGTDVAVNHAGGTQMSTTQYIQFKPDGSAAAATLYVDGGNAMVERGAYANGGHPSSILARSASCGGRRATSSRSSRCR